MSYEAIGQGIKACLGNISSLKRIYAPEELPTAISERPCALILPGEIDYSQARADEDTLKYRVIILLGEVGKPDRFALIPPYTESIGDSSVPKAIQDDYTLSGAAAWARITKNKGAGYTEWGGANYTSTEFELEVTAPVI